MLRDTLEVYTCSLVPAAWCVLHLQFCMLCLLTLEILFQLKKPWAEKYNWLSVYGNVYALRKFLSFKSFLIDKKLRLADLEHAIHSPLVHSACFCLCVWEPFSTTPWFSWNQRRAISESQLGTEAAGLCAGYFERESPVLLFTSVSLRTAVGAWSFPSVDLCLKQQALWATLHWRTQESYPHWLTSLAVLVVASPKEVRTAKLLAGLHPAWKLDGCLGSWASSWT